MKITIIGAGSNFGGRLSRDILSLPELQHAHIQLVDIHAERLQQVQTYVQRIIDGHNLPARVTISTDRREALPGTDYVVTSISVGGLAYAGFPFRAEIEIPRKYGVDQSVADTIGPGGVFRFLRTGPVQLDICRDMEELCPNALLLNYTNPMAMLTWLHSEGSSIANVGLCHSVQWTIHELSEYLGIKEKEVDFWCAGINHQAWFMRMRHNGEDLYPILREKLNDPETVAKDTVRFEMMKQFGLFVTESTRHCSEYHPYFRRTQELRDQFGLESREVTDDRTEEREYNKANAEAEAPKLITSNEYAAQIIRAIETGVAYRFNGNVMNTGLISNLPDGCCVEVPCLVDKQGVQPTHVGYLPTHLAHLNMTNIAVQELAVQAVMESDREAAFYACAMDPLTRAVCSLDQIRSMFDELWEVESEAGLLNSFK